MSSSIGSNTIRFTGLSSGVDTEPLVKAMLYTQQNKINKQIKKQQLYTWKQDAWKEMNSKINTFKDKYFDVLNKKATFIKTKATVSNDKAISVSENSNIGNGIHKVSVKELTTSAYMQTGKIDSSLSVKRIDDTTTLGELGLDKAAKLNIGGNEIDVSETTTIGVLKTALADEKINLSISSDNKITLMNTDNVDLEIKLVKNTEGDPDTESKFLSALGVGSGASLKIEKDKSITGNQLRETTITENTRLGNILKDGNPLVSSELSLYINGSDPAKNKITLTANDTLGSMMSKMKSVDSHFSINLDTGNNQFFVTSTCTGSASKTQITSTDAAGANLLTELGLVHQGAASTLTGTDAEYTYNGMAFTSSSNIVKINGLELTLKEKTGTEEVTIQGTTDTDGIVSFMKEFVAEYNKLLEEVNTKLSTKTSNAYEPLTDEEKEATSDANVEKIEKYVKDGLFYRDEDLTTLRDSLRDTMSGVVVGNSKYKTLNSIGLTTGSWRENGKLYFDEETFVKALSENQEDVLNLFAGSGKTEEAVSDYMKQKKITDRDQARTEYNALNYKDKQIYLRSSKGIFNRITGDLSKLSGSSDYKTYGSFYNDKLLKEDLSDIKDLLVTLNAKYTTREKALYKKFTAMEKAIGQLNSQQSSLTSMMGA